MILIYMSQTTHKKGHTIGHMIDLRSYAATVTDLLSKGCSTKHTKQSLLGGDEMSDEMRDIMAEVAMETISPSSRRVDE
jgi:hypothetical protein